MQSIIKLKLIGLGYDKEGYDLMGKMHWLDEKNDITFIITSKLIDSNIFMLHYYNFLIPSIINYNNYLKIEKQYGGLPITLEKNETKYLKWLKTIKFYDFIDQNNIELDLNRKYWYIYPDNYKLIKKINFELKKNQSK